MWSDNETERDFLNFGTVATTVSQIIEQANGQPVSIGVSGSWGVGKSSMIKLIQNKLHSDPGSELEKNTFLSNSMLGFIKDMMMRERHLWRLSLEH